nr:insulinase family protein [Clostridia bacterium]
FFHLNSFQLCIALILKYYLHSYLLIQIYQFLLFLYNYYKELIKKVKIDIFVSGDMNEDNISELKQCIIEKNLNERNANYNINKENQMKEKIEEPKVVTESMQITQGKLILGLDVLENKKESKYATSVYNIILGGSANSKMFQNVREKASLAYSAGSSYLRQKDNVFIKCGIDIPNYEKALDIIKEQLEQMKTGDFNDEDISNAKTLIEASVGSVPESQDSEITYYFAQELSDDFVSIENYISRIKKITKEQIVEIANKIQINTIYFLKD